MINLRGVFCPRGRNSLLSQCHSLQKCKNRTGIHIYPPPPPHVFSCICLAVNTAGGRVRSFMLGDKILFPRTENDFITYCVHVVKHLRASYIVYTHYRLSGWLHKKNVRSIRSCHPLPVHLSALQAWCKQYLSGRWKPDVLRPATV